MRRIIGIVESEAAPKNKLEMWLFKGNLKYFGPNGWESVGGGGDYTLPAATTSTLGGVKMATNISNAPAGADTAALVTKVNAILSALKAAGIMVKDVS